MSEYLMPSDAIEIVLAIIAETAMQLQSFFLGLINTGFSSVDMKSLHISVYQQKKVENINDSCAGTSIGILSKVCYFETRILQSTSLTKLSLAISTASVLSLTVSFFRH